MLGSSSKSLQILQCKKLPLSQKCFGVFKHKVDKDSKIVDGFENEFLLHIQDILL